MKEAMFADDPLVEEDEEGEDGSDDEEVKEEAVNGSKNGESEVSLGADENGPGANNHEEETKSDPVPPSVEACKPSDEIVSIPMYKLEVDEDGKVKGEKEKVEEEKVEEKVVTSMYGKVYKLKPGAAT